MTAEEERQELLALGRAMLVETFGTADLQYAAALVMQQEQQRPRLRLVWDRDKQ